MDFDDTPEEEAFLRRGACMARRTPDASID